MNTKRLLQIEGMLTASVLLALSGTCWAEADDDYVDWNKRRLFHPTPQELQAEEQGQIIIYDYLRSTDIERALDEEFDRVESMMFVRVVKTQPDGKPKLDPQTGSYEVEDDGCD